MNTTVTEKASVLAFERKLDPSDALMFAGDWNDRSNSQTWAGIKLDEKSVRGTISNRLKAKDQDPAKLDAAIENPNLQTVDIAALPHLADTLKVQFTLRVLGGTGTPSACNEPTYKARVTDVVSKYVSDHGFKELSSRYAYNLANGRFLWRNRIGAEQVEVVVERLSNGAAESRWTFDALSLPLREFVDPPGSTEALSQLASVIDAGLKGAEHVLLRVSAYARLGAGQEVFPSQELILDQKQRKTDDGKTVRKSKTLYSVEVGEKKTAAIHTQKIGNAIRTVDTWYPDAAGLTPIAIEPYGSVTTQGKAYRQPKQKADFYTLLDDWMLKDKTPDVGNQHFVIGVLIRGGVFGDAG